MSLQEEELVSSHAGQPDQASSLLDQIMAQTRIQPGSEGYDVARQGVTAFIASILQSTASAEPVNKLAVDSMIADIDERISRQMDVIIHAPAFQQVESFWRSLKTMVDRVDFRENIKVNVLHVTKQELLEDFEFAPEIIQSGFYKHVYSSGFGQFGGEPIAAVLGAYEFKNTAPDMKLLQYVSAVGAMAHAPFLSSVSPEFMGLNSWTELPNIKDLYAIFEGPAYTKWRALRDSEDSRYLGLTAPRFLLRQPYSPTDNPVKEALTITKMSAGTTKIICGVIRPGCWRACRRQFCQIPLVSKYHRSAKRRRSERSAGASVRNDGSDSGQNPNRGAGHRSPRI